MVSPEAAGLHLAILDVGDHLRGFIHLPLIWNICDLCRSKEGVSLGSMKVKAAFKCNMNYQTLSQENL